MPGMLCIRMTFWNLKASSDPLRTNTVILFVYLAESFSSHIYFDDVTHESIVDELVHFQAVLGKF